MTPAFTNALGPALTLDLALTLDAHLRLGLLGVFDFGGTTDVLDAQLRTRGTFTTRGGLALAHGAWCFDLPLRTCTGLLAGAHVDEGTASGPYIFSTATARTAAFVFGPSLQLAWLAGPFRLALDASLLVSPAPSTFTVTDLASPHLPVLQGLFRLSVGAGGGP